MTDGLGGRIRELRSARGITQRELAEPGYSRSFLAAVESGHRVPTDEALSYLAGRLGVDPDDLRHGRPPGAAESLRAELLEARQRLSQGDPDRAGAMIEDILDRATQYGLPGIIALALLGQGDVVMHRDGPEQALPIFFRGLGTEPSALSSLASRPPGSGIASRGAGGVVAQSTRSGESGADVSQGEAASLGGVSGSGGDLGVAGVVRARLASRVSQCHYLMGQTAQAISIGESALNALRANPPVDPAAELILLGALIYPCVEVGAIERARRAVDEGLALLPRLTDVPAIADFYTVATQLWHADGKLSEVDVALNTAREIYTKLGWEREIGRCHWTRGYVLVRMDRLAEAGRELTLAREILRQVGARHFHAGATLELAEVRRKEGLFDAAEELCHEAAEYVTSAGYDEGIAETDRLLGRVAIARGDLRRAEELLNLAAQRYSRAGLNTELMRTCRELGELLMGQQRLDEALSILQRGIACV